jgi:hypothetical protein
MTLIVEWFNIGYMGKLYSEICTWLVGACKEEEEEEEEECI